MIHYERHGDWSGYTLTERQGGTWRYEIESRIQGNIDGYVAIIRPPDWWHAEDEADLDSLAYNPVATKADMLIHHGHIRCLRRGHKVQ